MAGAGEVFSSLVDLGASAVDFTNNFASGNPLAITGDLITSLGTLAVTAQAFAEAHGMAGTALMAGAAGAALNLNAIGIEAANIAAALRTNNTDKAIESGIALAGAIGGAMTMNPGTATPGLAINLLAGAMKFGWKNKDGEIASKAAALMRPLFDPLFDGMSPEMHDAISAAMNWRRPKDPLTLDLDGDGIEATSIDTAHPILFDHDADGMKTATGWIKADDGLVVMDRNGNGQIDSGRELFGDNTLLANGVFASNGFEALAELDSNGDLIIDASDAAFAHLRVWRDLNQDGVSQPAELYTLADLDVVAIGVHAAATNINLGNGNTQPWSGTFSRSNGTTGTTGTPELSGSLLLASNNFFRTFTDDPAITTAARLLPQVHGSGAVRDLREAMSLNTLPAAALQDAVARFAVAETRDTQMALLDELIEAWGATSSMEISAQTETRYEWYRPWTGNIMPPADYQSRSQLNAVEGFAQIHPAQAARWTALERFNGDAILSPLVSYVTMDSSGGYSATVAASPAQQGFLESAYGSLAQSVYSALVVQTRLKPYLDSVELVFNESGVHYDTTPLTAMLQARHDANAREALFDLADLALYAGESLAFFGFNAVDLLRTWVDALPSNDPLRSEFPVMHMLVGTGAASEFSELFLGSPAADTFFGAAGDDVISGGAGNDELYGGTGNDMLDGGAGDDVLLGDWANLRQGSYSGAGSDTYLFGRGGGHDTIGDFDNTSDAVDRIVFKPGVLPQDVRVSREGVHLVLSIIGTQDRISVTNFFRTQEGADAWSIEEVHFTDVPGVVWIPDDLRAAVLIGTSADERIDAYESADLLQGNGGIDYLYGYGGNDTLEGGDGNDNLQAGTGDDTLDGGAGDDELWGDHGYAPNNVFSGAGNDTYLFGRGDGRDVIYDQDSTAGNVDRIVFKAGVSPADVTASRNGTSLVLRIAGTSDQITVANYFASSDVTAEWAIEEIRFQDDANTVWSTADVRAKVLIGGAGDDSLQGYASNDVMAGHAGNDILRGAAGADTMQGGDGNDILHGDAGDDQLDGGAGDDSLFGGNDGGDSRLGNFPGPGNDTYLFGRGDGNDHIYDLDTTAGNKDRIVFKAGVLPADVIVSNSGESLVLRIAGTQDVLTGVNHFSIGSGAGAWQVEEVRFTDEATTVWTQADIARLSLTGTAGADTISGYASDDVLTGLGGDDFLLGGAGNDTLDGGAGNDMLIGSHVEYGYNAWSGAGVGNDTYLFGRGDGQDTVQDHDETAGNLDRVLFKAGVLPNDVQVTRSGLDLVLKINGSTDQITVKNHFAGDGLGGWAVEEVRFTDAPSTVWDLAAISALSTGGSSGDDTLQGSAGDDSIDGGAGNDLIYGGAGNDTLAGGSGNDHLNGDAGNDMLLGGAGDDLLYGGVGDDVIDGGAGDDMLVGNYIQPGPYYVPYGYAHGEGSDTYLFGRGDGQDWLRDYDTTPGAVDKIVFKAGVSPQDVLLVRSNLDLLLKISGTTDQVTVQNFFSADASDGWAVEQVKFTDAPSTVWDIAYIKAALLADGGAATTVVGYDSDDVISAGGGNDTVYAHLGNDTIDGGAGDDFLNGEGGNDVLLGGSGDDLLYGGVGDDVFDGGAGNDTLAGAFIQPGPYYVPLGYTYGEGNDTYLFGRGDGQDWVRDYETTAGIVDKIVFKAGVLPQEVRVTKTGNDLVLKIDGTTDQITVQNYFVGDANSGWVIEKVQFTSAPTVDWNFTTVSAILAGGGTYVPPSTVPTPLADFAFDGKADVLWHNSVTGEVHLWRDGLQSQTTVLTTVSDVNWHIAAVADFTGDGKADMWWRNVSTGANSMWASGESTLTQSLPGVATDWKFEATGDFAGDGKSDVVWRNTTTGEVHMWRDGLQSQTSVLATVPTEWRPAATGDFTGDGKTDLWWRNLSTGQNELWTSGDPAQGHAMTGVAVGAWSIVATGDFAGDGKADVLWRNSSTGENHLWRDGLQSQTTVLETVALEWTTVIATDTTGDGKVDLLWRNESTGQNFLWDAGNSSQVVVLAPVSGTAWKVVPVGVFT